MNIVLTSIHIEKSPDAIPLAPALLKSSLLKNLSELDLNISIHEGTLKSSISSIAMELLNYKPNVIGFSIYLWNRDFYIKLASEIKKLNKNIILIAGGPEIRSSYKSLLDNGIDYTIQGEGEEIICELIDYISKNKNPSLIPGINDEVNRYIKYLDSIPSPILNNNLFLSNYDGYLWELSRGCPYSCDFCFESRGSKGVRYYTFDRIEKELDLIINKNTDQVFVLDPTFNKDLIRAKKILSLIKKKNRGTHFHFEIRAELLDFEIATLFSEIGASLQIGIQSSNDDVLKLINRRIDKPLFKNKISLLNDVGAIFGLDLIFGLPGDSYEGFKESMEFVLSLQPNHVDIFPLAILPGTALWDNSSKLELKFMSSPPYTVIQSPTYSIEDMKKSFILKNSCDFIYNKCKSTGWLDQVCKELRVKVTDFIEGFHNWNVNNRKSITEIETIKLYIKDMYTPKRFELIEDIINYHNYYSKALLAPKKNTNVPSKDIFTSVPKFSETTTLINFSYPILDAFDNGHFTINSIKKGYVKNKNRCVSWFHSGGEVVFDSYSKKIMNFLSKIDGKKNCKDIDSQIDLDFLIFSQDSGMLNFN